MKYLQMNARIPGFIDTQACPQIVAPHSRFVVILPFRTYNAERKNELYTLCKAERTGMS
jgi:hypothetical protein